MKRGEIRKVVWLIVTEIAALLREEVELNRQAYENAKTDFRSIAVDLPGGLPHSAGVRRIQNAARAQDFAMLAYKGALKRFHEFLVNGTLPDYLKTEAEKKAASSEPPEM